MAAPLQAGLAREEAGSACHRVLRLACSRLTGLDVFMWFEKA